MTRTPSRNAPATGSSGHLRRGRWRRPSLAVAILAAAMALYGALGLTRVGPDEMAVREGALLRSSPVLLAPGRHLAPPGLFRMSRYPRGPASVSFGGPEPLPVVTPEGSTLLGEGSVDYALAADRVVDLHARCGGDLDGFLRGKIASALAQTVSDPALAPVSPARLPDVERAGARLLEAMLEGDGVQVRAVRLTRLGYQGAAASVRPTARRKVLWIGLDSYDWDIIQPLVEAGRMPHLARLMQEGSWGNLQTVAPLLSPVIWTSVATGKRPDKHGIVDFVATDPKTGAVLPVTSTLRKARAFWNILGDAGVSVGVVAWWASFPAEPVEGFMCTDRISYQLFRGRIKEGADDDPFKTYPADLYRRIAPLIVAPASVDGAELSRFIDLERYASRFSADDRSRVEELQTVLAAARTYAGIGMTMFQERPTDVRVIYFEGPDTASHLFMPFVTPVAAGQSAEKADWFGGVVSEFYEYQDEVLGRFLAAFADEETTVILNSDHGFKIGSERPDTDSRISRGKAADWHSREGMVLLAGKDVRKGGRILGASVLDLVPTLLALYGLPIGEDMDGKVLAAALEEGFLSDHPPATIATYETGERPSPSAEAFLAEDQQELLAKLQSLGYVQQDKPTASLNQGTIAMQAGRHEEAIAAFTAALRGMDEPSVRLNLARAYRLAKRFDEAQRELEGLRVHGWKPEAVLAEMSALARDRKDFGGAERLLEQAMKADPGSAQSHMQAARLHELQERWEEALASYQRAAAADPALAEAHNQAGVVLKRLGRTREAIAAFERAIEVNPDMPGPYNNLGLVHREMGRREESRRVLETGVTMAPKSAVLHNSLGSLYHDGGDVERAVQEFETALRHDPSYAEAVSNLAVIHTGRRDVANATRYLKRLIELEPSNHEARLSLALGLLSQRRVPEAMALVEEVLKAEPAHHKALMLLGEIHLRGGRHEEAARLLEQAGRIDGKSPRLWNDLAGCYLALGRKDAARDAMRKSLGLNPNQPEVSRRLAEIGG